MATTSHETRTSALFDGGIAPLLWHHGEPPERIAGEMAAIRSAGIHEFILEPRPHPDYLGSGWWRDVQFVVEEARRSGMRLWLFDDGRFPSGWAGGQIPQHYPELLKRFLAVRRIDVHGPLAGAVFKIGAWLEPGDAIVSVVACPRDAVADVLDIARLVDLTGQVRHGRLVWDLPSGAWRISIVIETSHGGEAETASYINPMDSRAAAAMIETIHEPHRAHFGLEFGQTIRGFFQDEPRFGNAPFYDALPGRGHRVTLPGAQVPADLADIVLPWSPQMLADVEETLGEPAARLLPLLWFDADPSWTTRVRFAYMDVASRRFAGYLGALGDWCRSQGLMLIGHLVEDNGAHARLGYGPGHYFRAIASQDAAGIDVVHQLHPGETEGKSASPFGYLNSRFFHWGLAKLASSAAHILPRAGGRAMCEAFGAYGWQAGLRTMVWLTDHLYVRGVNALVPHAFSPRIDDPDCPPHFYNGGTNPQWSYFDRWVDYTNLLTSWLAGGRHHADAAVLYHAEAEWAGAAQPFEVPLAELARRQLDADVVPADVIIDASYATGPVLQVADETYPVLIVPQADRWPAALLEALARLVVRGVPIIAVDALSVESSTRPVGADAEARLRQQVRVVPLDSLAEAVARLVSPGVVTTVSVPELRVLHVEVDGDHRYFLVNESTTDGVDVGVRLAGQAGQHPRLLDPATGDEVEPSSSEEGRDIIVRIILGPNESRLLRFCDMPGRPVVELAEVATLPTDGWAVAAAGVGVRPDVSITLLGSVSTLSALPDFGGTLTYSRTVHLPAVSADAQLDLGAVGEIGRVRLNGIDVGVRLRAPYRFPIGVAAREGLNDLVVDVTTTAAHGAVDNAYDRAAAIPPSGLMGPVVLLDRLATEPPAGETGAEPGSWRAPRPGV